MILITGARGHIGNVLVRTLYEKGYRDLRLLVQGNASFLKPYAKEIVHGDIRDAKAVESAVQGCTDVFHLAGYIHMTGSNKQLLQDINVGGVKNIVNACLKHGVKRLVHVSSIHALLPDEQLNIDETVDPDLSRCGDEYSRTKLQGTLEVLDACKNRGLNAVIVYPTGVVGPHDYRASMTGIMVKKYMGARGMQLCFDGQFDFVDVRDVAQGIYLAWQNGRSGEGYILTGEPCKIADMIEMIAGNCGQSVKTLQLPVCLVRAAAYITPVYYSLTRKTPIFTRATVDVMRSMVKISNKKAKNELGFCPRPLSETMADTVNWHARNSSLN